MKKTVFIILLAILLFAPLASFAQGLGEYHSRTLVMHDTLPRSYILYEPPGYTPGEEWPLVFAFHGRGVPPLEMASWIEMYLVADTAKFFIVYPSGMEVSNAYGLIRTGWIVPGQYFGPHNDIDFVNQMINDIIDNPDFAIDTNRIFSTGMSNGGEFTYCLACELSDRVASFASVSAQMVYAVMDYCEPARVISIYHNQGTEDVIWPANGGPTFPPLEGTAEYWAAIANCSLEPTVTYLPDIDPGDGSTVTLLTYDSCYTGYEVLCYRIEGGVHIWPGGQNAGQPGFNNDVHTSSEIWKFFRRNPHPRTYSYCFPAGVSFLSQEDIDNFPLKNPNCTEIQGDVIIKGNDITDLSGLNMITGIGGSLSIYANNSMTDLNGLDNLQSIGGHLEIGKDTPLGVLGNPLLTSLNGLENIEHSSIENLTIISNPLLSDCKIENICEYLLSPNGIVEIHDNAVGCNDSLEIRNACEGVNINELYEIVNLSLCPNPFTTSTTLSFRLEKPENMRFTVYNLQSQIVFSIEERRYKGRQEILWNAEGLPAGIYFYRLNAGDRIASGKLVVVGSKF
jgi:polyhydroxybutyrate depolymerase